MVVLLKVNPLSLDKFILYVVPISPETLEAAQTTLGLATETFTVAYDALPNQLPLAVVLKVATDQDAPKLALLQTPVVDTVNTTSGLLLAFANLE